MSDISRRNLLKGAAVSAVSISAMGLLGACAAPSEPKAETTTDPSADGAGTGSGTNSEYMAEVLEPTSMPDASTASNFNIIYDSKTTVGTTYENLMTAIAGETGATTKYEAFSKVAKNEGFDVLARLFQCTADAEKIHIGLEYDLAKEIDPATEKPEPPAVEEHESDINLISGANGEIYETSDMYPSFIKKAQEEGNNMMGAMPGLQVTGTSGQPGAEMSFNIRGVNTVSYTHLRLFIDSFCHASCFDSRWENNFIHRFRSR